MLKFWFREFIWGLFFYNCFDVIDFYVLFNFCNWICNFFVVLKSYWWWMIFIFFLWWDFLFVKWIVSFVIDCGRWICYWKGFCNVVCWFNFFVGCFGVRLWYLFGFRWFWEWIFICVLRSLFIFVVFFGLLSLE